MLDVLGMGILGADCIMAKQSVASNIITRNVLIACRSIIVKKSANAFQLLKERYDSDENWPAITIYAEGSISNH